MLKKKRGVDYKEGESILAANQSKEWVEDYAAQVVNMFAFKPGARIDVLVALLGGRIHYQHIDEWSQVSGSLYVHGQGDFDVGLPHYTSPMRDRFTVAHELGHYFLHSRQGRVPVVAYRSGSTRIEWEANWFAAALLMPEGEFKKAHVEMRGNIYSVADYFCVSAEAAQVRARVILGE